MLSIGTIFIGYIILVLFTTLMMLIKIGVKFIFNKIKKLFKLKWLKK